MVVSSSGSPSVAYQSKECHLNPMRPGRNVSMPVRLMAAICAVATVTVKTVGYVANNASALYLTVEVHLSRYVALMMARVIIVCRASLSD